MIMDRRFRQYVPLLTGGPASASLVVPSHQKPRPEAGSIANGSSSMLA
jgi:hypothetical protein